MVLYDPEKNKAIQLCSDKEFNFKAAYNTVQNLRKTPGAVEYMTSADYEKLDSVDLHTAHYQRPPGLNSESDFSFEVQKAVKESKGTDR